ncbi:MAG: lamin tail domain-containing protein [Parcubacteria group bacterium]|jgi:PKD repeat protein
MKKIIFIFILLSAGTVSFFARTNPSRANSAPHIIINEIQTSGASSNDEFIELFNPTDHNADISSWSIQYHGGNANTFYKKNFGSSDSIPAHGYFLVAHGSSYAGAMEYDMSWSQSFSESGGTVFLVSNQTMFTNENLTDSVMVDRVAYGTGNSLVPETTSAPAPESGKSIERTDFIDTEDNAADFSINISPSPQNSGVIESDSDESSGSDESKGDAENDENGPSEDTGKNSVIIPDTSNPCADASGDIKLNEIFPYPESGNEFVEIMNTGENCVDVSGWKIMDEAGHKKEFPEKSIVNPEAYLFLEGNLYLNNDSDTVYLLNKNGNTKNDALDSRHFEKAQKGFSYSFDGKIWQWTSSSAPGEENIITTADSKESAEDSGAKEDSGNSDSAEIYSSAEGAYFNEILPNPKDGSDNEYIEIANGESGPVDLRGWTIRDGSKSGKYVFKEHLEIGTGEYFALYKTESKIALNNSNESVNLYNPKDELVSSVSFDKSSKNSSYNFDGKNWKWSKYLTPGKKNKFDSEPTVKIEKPKRVYKDIYTEFSAKAKDKETKKLKYAWDFGDGKKSHLAKTSHKYLDTGKYTVTLTVSDDSQTVEKSFTIAVKKYPRSDLEIVKIVPNPAGKDSDGEIIEIKNSSKKKVELDGWKIATGSGEKNYNHPISDGITLDSGETQTITREISKFSLNNKTGKIQLISPDEKITDEVEYSKEKIDEGEAYEKIDGEWQWISTPEKEESSEEEGSSENGSDDSDEGEVLGVINENISNNSSYTPEDAYIFFKTIGFFEYRPQERSWCPKENLCDMPLLISSI